MKSEVYFVKCALKVDILLDGVWCDCTIPKYFEKESLLHVQASIYLSANIKISLEKQGTADARL